MRVPKKKATPEAKRNNDMLIYKTTNLINGKVYVGRQVHDNPNYIGSGKIIRRAIKKYGINNFKKEILEYCFSISHLNDREKYWIVALNSTDKTIGYNIMLGGQGGNTFTDRRGSLNPMYGKPRDQKTKDAIAKANRLRPKVYGNENKSYKDIPSNVKGMILQFSQNMGRDKMGIRCVSPRSITRRLKEWLAT
jgi:hypothetical protein